MESNGTLTPEQASLLRKSLATPQQPVHRKLPVAWIAAAAAVLIAVTLLLVTGGEPTPPAPPQEVAEIFNQSGETGTMEKGITTTMSLLLILAPILLCVLGIVWVYNSLVSKEEEVLGAWAQVEASYQRRADLVPNLVEAVKGFTEQEQTILTEIAHSRERAISTLADAGRHLEDDTALAQTAEAQQALGHDLGRLMALAESYPTLRSADNFLALQDQLEGTENRITVARMVFNDSVRDFNAATRKLPGALIADWGGFRRKAYFEAQAGTEQGLAVEFE